MTRLKLNFKKIQIDLLPAQQGYDRAITVFSPDGRFMAVFFYDFTLRHYISGIGVFRRMEASRTGQNEFDAFAPNRYQFIPTPEGLHSFEDIIWMADSSSFVALGYDLEEGSLDDRKLRLKFVCDEDGHFTQSEALSLDLAALTVLGQ